MSQLKVKKSQRISPLCESEYTEYSKILYLEHQTY
jgi:hypothetical protein